MIFQVGFQAIFQAIFFPDESGSSLEDDFDCVVHDSSVRVRLIQSKIP